MSLLKSEWFSRRWSRIKISHVRGRGRATSDTKGCNVMQIDIKSCVLDKRTVSLMPHHIIESISKKDIEEVNSQHVGGLAGGHEVLRRFSLGPVQGVLVQENQCEDYSKVSLRAVFTCWHGCPIPTEIRLSEVRLERVANVSFRDNASSLMLEGATSGSWAWMVNPSVYIRLLYTLT